MHQALMKLLAGYELNGTIVTDLNAAVMVGIKRESPGDIFSGPDNSIFLSVTSGC